MSKRNQPNILEQIISLLGYLVVIFIAAIASFVLAGTLLDLFESITQTSFNDRSGKILLVLLFEIQLIIALHIHWKWLSKKSQPLLPYIVLGSSSVAFFTFLLISMLSLCFVGCIGQYNFNSDPFTWWALPLFYGWGYWNLRGKIQ